MNVFAYCYNDPILLSDSTGNRPVIGAHPQKEEDWAAINEYMRTKAIAEYRNGCSNSKGLSSQEIHKNATTVHDYLSNNGWSENAIAATLGNMYAESRINPAQYQNGGKGPGYGIVQWDPASKYLDWAEANGRGKASLLDQVDYLIYSMQPGNGQWFCHFKNSQYYMPYSDFIVSNADITYLTQVFLWSYERPSLPHTQKRIDSANYWFNYFSNR